MKRIITALAMVAILSLLLLGCSSPAEQAQTMFNNGQYQELLDKFGSNPEMAALVEQAKNKLADMLFEEEKYEEILEMYPESPAAMAAKNKIAEKLFEAGNYDELLAKYADTPAAMKARLAMEQARGDSLAEVTGEQGKQITTQKKEMASQQETIERAAERELERIMNIKNPRLRDKALQEFAANAKFKGTKAQNQAKTQLGK